MSARCVPVCPPAPDFGGECCYGRQTPSRSEILLWDGDDPLAWLTPGSDPNQVLVHGAAQEVRTVGTKTGGVALQRQLHLDNLNAVEALTDATQSVETDYRTDAWGNVLSGAAQDNPLVYHGGLGYWSDPDLGLYYIRARWPDPVTGRWLSADPVETEPRYGYAGNSPTTKVDPSGRQRKAQGILGALAEPWEEFWDDLQKIAPSGEDVQNTLRAAAELNPQRVVERAALATYRAFLSSLPQPYRNIARKFLPPDTDGSAVARWFSDFRGGFTGGFVASASATASQVLSTAEFLNDPMKWYGEHRGEIGRYLQFLSTEAAYFQRVGLTPEAVFARYIQEPLVRATIEVMSSRSFPPYELGEIIGEVAFQILLMIAEEVITEGLASGAELAQAGAVGSRAAGRLARGVSEARSSVRAAAEEMASQGGRRVFNEVEDLAKRSRGNREALGRRLRSLRGTAPGDVVDAWFSGLKRRPPRGTAAHHAYQIKYCGREEYLLTAGNPPISIWADGIDRADLVALEAKHVGDARVSPYVPGSKATPHVREMVRQRLESEPFRYGEVIHDPSSLLKGLKIITNDERAGQYLRDMMKTYKVPGWVVIRPD